MALTDQARTHYKSILDSISDPAEKNEVLEGIKYAHSDGRTSIVGFKDDLRKLGQRSIGAAQEKAVQAQEEKESRGDFIPGVKRGIDTTQGMLYGAGALAGRGMKAVGMDETGQDVMDWGMKGYTRNMAEAAENPAKYSFKDVYTGKAGFGGAIDWTQGTLGELVPSMAEAAVGTLLGTLAGGAAGSSVGPGGTAAGAIGGGAAGAFAGRTILKNTIDKLTKEGLKSQIQKGLIKEGAEAAAEAQIRQQVTRQALRRLGGKVGMGAAVMPLETGGMYAGLLEEKGVDAPGTALLFGALSTSLEYAGGNSRLVDMFVDALGKGSGGMVKKTAKELLKNIPEEALQEGGQELMGILNTVVNTDEKLLTAENVEQIVESAGAGAIGGGAGAVSSGVLSRGDSEVSGKAKGTDHNKASAAEKLLMGDEIGKTPEELILSEEELQAQKWEAEILNQRKGPSIAQRNQARINAALSDEEQVIRDRNQAMAGKSDFLQKLDMMQAEVNGSETRGVTQEKVGQQSETVVFGASSPRWMQEIQEARKKRGEKALSRKELNVLFDKARAGAPLTENQQGQYFEIEQAINNYTGETGEFIAQEEANDLERKGYELYGGQKMRVSNLNPGDVFHGTVNNEKGEFTVKSIDEKGIATIQGQNTHQIDISDSVSVDAMRRNPPQGIGPVSKEELRQEGYDVFQEKKKISVTDLKEGDKIVGTIDGVKDEYTVKGINDNGEVLFQDGITRRLDMFDEVSVDGIKRGEDRPQDQEFGKTEFVEVLEGGLVGSDQQLQPDTTPVSAPGQQVSAPGTSPAPPPAAPGTSPGIAPGTADDVLTTGLKNKEQQAFVDHRIKKLGSIEAVDKAYSLDDKVSQYARAKAREVFGQDAPVEAAKPIEETQVNPKKGKPASVKVMITRADEKALNGLGYSQDQINKMKPDDARVIIKNSIPLSPEPSASEAQKQAISNISDSPDMPQPKSWFDVGERVNFEYKDPSGKSIPMRPNKKLLKEAADRLGISVTDAHRGLSVYHSGTPQYNERLFKDKKIPQITMADKPASIVKNSLIPEPVESKVIQSKGHIGFFTRPGTKEQVEVYKDAKGEVYTAPVSNVIDVDTGYRIGRFEAPAHLADQAVKNLLNNTPNASEPSAPMGGTPPTVKENLTVAPGVKVAWQDKKGNTLSGELIRPQKKGGQLWQVRKADGKNTFVHEKNFKLNDSESTVVSGSQTPKNASTLDETEVNPVEKITGEKAAQDGTQYSTSADFTNSTRRNTDTPAFRKWFGDSKVVDGDGKPLAVYHGTDRDFNNFSNEKINANFVSRFADGFYFTEIKDNADYYANANGKPNGKVIPVYLSIKNPLIVEDDKEYRSTIQKGRYAKTRYERDQLISLRDSEILSRMGYDGVIYKYKGRMNEIVAFSPTQIKSLYNTGSWDGSNPDIRYSISSVKPWPEDFPNVTVHTTANKIAPNQKGQGGHPDHKAAKAGDVDAANRLVFDLVKPEKVLELKKQFPDAMVVPVHAEEEAGKNKIPRALARAYGEIAGFKVDLGIVQTNKSGHTKKDAAERIISRAEFDGDVNPGQEYIILDDIITTGETLSELRHYIENNGGKVVAASTLGYSKYSTVLAVKQDSLKKIQDKFNVKELEDVLKEFNIAGNIQALTNSEAKYILSFRAVDAFRNRILEAGRNRSGQSKFSVFQGEVRRFQEETWDSSSQRINTLPGQGLTTQQIQSHFKGQQAFLSPDGKVSIKFKGGQGCTVETVKKISDKDYEFAMRTGRMDKNGIILGKYSNQEIQLSRDYASDFTLDHEIEHLLEDMGIITPTEIMSLNGKARQANRTGQWEAWGLKWSDNMAENRANFLSQAIAEREQYRGTWLGRVIQKIVDFLDGLLYVASEGARVRKLARDVESGKAYSRPGKSESIQIVDLDKDISKGVVKSGTQNGTPVPRFAKIGLRETGELRVPRRTVRNVSDAAQMLSGLSEAAQEEVYLITADRTGRVLEVHKFAKGTSGKADAHINQMAGHLLKNEEAHTTYLIHNHISGDLTPSNEDLQIMRDLRLGLRLAGIKVSGLIISDGHYAQFDEFNVGGSQKIKQLPAKSTLPVSERRVISRELQNPLSIKDANAAMERFEGEQDGILLMDEGRREVAFIPFKKGVSIREAARDILAQASDVNAVQAVINMQTFTGTNRGKLYQHLAEGLATQNIDVNDIITKNPFGRLTSMFETNQLPAPDVNGMRALDSDETLYQTSDDFKTKVKGTDSVLKKVTSSMKGIVSPKDGAITTGLAGIDNVYDAKENKWFSEKDYEIHKSKVENINLQEDLLKAMGLKRYDKAAKDMDQAIHIYLDLKRNPGHLSQYYKDLKSEDQAIVDLAQTIDSTPRLKAIADQIADSYKSLGEKAQSEGIISQAIENYAGRTWKQNKRSSNQVFQKFVTRSRHSKHRVFETILEGLAAGMELQVTGATNNLQVVKEEIAKVIEDKKLLNILQKTEHLDTGEMIFTDKTGLEGYKKLEGHNFSVWKPYGNVKGGHAKDTFINDKGKEIKLGKNAMVQTRFAVENPETGRAFKVFDQESDAIAWQKEAGKGVVNERTVLWEKRQLWAPEAIADRLNKITGRSVLSGKFKVGGVSVVDTLTKYNAVAKSTLLMTGLFHHQAFMRSYLFGVNHKTRAEWNPIKAYKEGMQAVKNLDKEVELGVRNGLTLGLMQDWQEDLLATTDTVFGRVMDKHKISKAIKDKLNDLRERQAKFLFGELGVGLKAKAFIIEYRNAVRESPEMEENERARMVAGLINADFGGLHLGRMGRDPSLQHIFRLFALAPDWTESNIITMVKAIKAGNKAETNMYRKFWASVFTKSMIATFAMNVALGLAAGDDDEEFMDKFKRAWKAGHLKWMDVNITPIYKAMGGNEEAEKYFSLIGHFRDPIKFIVHPITSAKHKGSVLYRFFHEMMAGEDWKGAKFTNFSELIGVDDKGVYLTTRKGHHRAGDPKGGKLKGQTVSYRSDAKNGPIGFNQMPSYLLAQGKGVLPIQIQNLMGWMAGEINWFDAITKGAGFYTSSTYPTPDTIKQTFVDQVVQARLNGRNIADIAAKLSAYNKRRQAAGQVDEQIFWKDVVKKAQKVLQAQRLSESRR